MPTPSIGYTEYNETHFCVRGPRERFSEQIRRMNGRWHSALKGGSGWIVPKTEKNNLDRLIANAEQIDRLSQQPRSRKDQEKYRRADSDDDTPVEGTKSEGESEDDIDLDPIVQDLLDNKKKEVAEIKDSSREARVLSSRKRDKRDKHERNDVEPDESDEPDVQDECEKRDKHGRRDKHDRRDRREKREKHDEHERERHRETRRGSLDEYSPGENMDDPHDYYARFGMPPTEYSRLYGRRSHRDREERTYHKSRKYVSSSEGEESSDDFPPPRSPRQDPTIGEYDALMSEIKSLTKRIAKLEHAGSQRAHKYESTRHDHDDDDAMRHRRTRVYK